MITTSVRRSDVFTGNGTATDFNFTASSVYIPVKEATHIKVYKDTATDTNNAFQLVSTSNYTVSFAGSDNTNATVTFNNDQIPANNDKILLLREVPYTQLTDLTNNSLFDAESLESRLDSLTMQTQQLSDKVEYGFTIGETIADSPGSLDKTATERAGKFMSFDDNGDLTISSEDTEDVTDMMLETKDWANKVNGGVKDYQDGVVTGSVLGYSAKAHAIGGTDVDTTTGSAKDWATKASSTVGNTSTYSAKYYAEQVEATYDSFDDRYLGAHTTANRETGGNVGKDNDGNALLDGALYFDTTLDVMKVWDDTGSAWKQLTPTSTNQTNIDILTTKYDGSTTSGSGTNLNIAQVDTVADNIANVNKVGVIDANVTKVADIDDKVTTVADDGVDIGKVAGKETEIGRLGTNDMSDASNGYLTRLGTDAMANATTGHIKKLADVDSRISTLGPISADITSTAGVTTEMDTIVNKYDGTTASSGTTKNLALINSVHGKITEIGRLGTADAVTDLGILGTTDAVNDMNILSAGSVPDNMATVAGISGNVTTVAGISGNVTTVATSPVPANLATVAGSIADVNRYANEYKIQATAPGSPSEGHMWFDSSSNKTFKVYNGTSWTTVTEGQSAEEVNATSISMAIALG